MCWFPPVPLLMIPDEGEGSQTLLDLDQRMICMLEIQFESWQVVAKSRLMQRIAQLLSRLQSGACAAARSSHSLRVISSLIVRNR